MKKTFLAITMLAMMFASPSDMMAQSLLRRVANAAKSTVGDAVQGAVSSALGGKNGKAAAATGQTTTATPQTTAQPEAQTADSNEDGDNEYAASLGSSTWVDGIYFTTTEANQTGEYDNSNAPILRIKKPNLHFNNTLDMVKALPAVPTAKQIVDDAGNKATDVLINYELACEEYYARKMQEQMELSMKMASLQQHKPVGRPAPADPSSFMPTTKEFLDKVIAEARRRGLKLETMTEAQSMELTADVMSKEFGIPKAEMSKLVVMAQTDPSGATAILKQKYPAAAKKMGMIQAETSAMQQKVSPETEKFVVLIEELSSLLKDEKLSQHILALQKVSGELEAYALELQAQWPTSDTYAKLNAMERELDAKLNAHMEAHNMSYNDEAPGFWVEGRKAQNALIDAYNEKLAEQWRAKVQNYIDTYKPYAQYVAEAEARMDAAVKSMKAEDLATEYYTYVGVANMFGQISFSLLYQLPSTAMNAPRIFHVPEQWMP